MVEIDVSGAGRFQPYSARTLDLARTQVASRQVIWKVGSIVALCRSHTSRDLWSPVALFDGKGEIVGVTCDCPNGRKGGVRARCWHAAALEGLLDGTLSLPPRTP